MQFSLDAGQTIFVVLEPTCFECKKAHLDFLFSGEFFPRESQRLHRLFLHQFTKKIWDFTDGNDSSSKRLEEAAKYQAQYVLSGHYYGLFLTKISEIYPSLCSDDVYPLILDDDFHIDIDSANDLRIARMVLTGSAG